MNGSAVFLVAFLTSAATSIGTVYLVDRMDLFQTSPNQQMVSVPHLRGLEKVEAKTHAESLGLVLVVDGQEESATEGEGIVLRQSLPMGLKVSRGEKIGITVSKAMPKVPQVVGMSLEKAAETLKQAGYGIKEEPVKHAEIPQGQVVNQKPEQGTALEKDGVVTVQVSQGAGQVEVPKLSGFSYSKATKTLEELGLSAKVRWVDLPETWSGVVLNQTPAPEEKVAEGSDVEIVINR